MIIRVQFESSLRDMAGMRSLDVELPMPSSLQDLLLALQERFGKGILGQSSEYSWRHASSHVLILKNGESVGAGETTGELADGDTITVLPPLAGGAFQLGEHAGDGTDTGSKGVATFRPAGGEKNWRK